ncbi:sortilin-like isoform X2 [Littorina saxatilis]|uniref:sortilin-like isoform X2 n=1 Tax=Littorina saxatilis TaxID=31220 RepID=UPI0038B69E5B
MTTANMEVTGKCSLFCKLLFSAVCLLTTLHTAQTSHVVSFNQLDSDLVPSDLSETIRHTRRKRSDETNSEREDAQCDSQREKFQNAITGGKRLETTHIFKDESKFSLAMAWASANDDGVLIVLTSERNIGTSDSTLWRSTDAGRTWKNTNSKVDNAVFRKSDGLQRNPHASKWVYLISEEHFLYKSENGGDTWAKVVLPSLEIVGPDLIFHGDEKYKDHIMIITTNKKLLMTKNNFKTLDVVQERLVQNAHWGTDASGSATDMFMLYGQQKQDLFPFFMDSSVTVYELQRRSVDRLGWKTVKKNVVDFGIQGDFLYASVYKGDNPDINSERLLIVSNDNGEHWNEAQLPTITSDRFFSVLDMSEGLIFMHVDNPGDTGHGTLYTSASKGIFFSTSLQRHLYPNFNSITDFYKVTSMQGTYIASQLDKDNSIHSVITFDLGGEWHPLTKPEGTKCRDDAKECSLQIHNTYSLHRGVNAHPPMSADDAIGLIIVNAHAAANLQITDPDVFISSDGGYSWRKALDGPHSYIIADSGGLIVAMSLKTPTPTELKFSTDEGRCWHNYQFTNETIHHTGLLTEPGGKSMTVAVWGYNVDNKKWTVNVIDFTDVVGDRCSAEDYEEWIPHESMKKEDPKRQACLLGSKVKYQRLKHDSWCHNGYTYTPDKTKQICPCGYDDFECDYGYHRTKGQDKCVEDSNFRGPEIDVCFRGHEQKVISEGYRKLPGDVCNEQSGFSPTSKRINLTTVCTERIKVATLSPAELKVGLPRLLLLPAHLPFHFLVSHSVLVSTGGQLFWFV